MSDLMVGFKKTVGNFDDSSHEYWGLPVETELNFSAFIKKTTAIGGVYFLLNSTSNRLFVPLSNIRQIYISEGN